ncbi:hypothetical protein [Planomicrobium sp. YIM 101495]|uniref:hypothetical protein n=1 Tax=Planomicrobium sp. YIM 101495 TaxID=2665160 RepID=UPI0012B7E37B|nr:hypothetical protein [Planomicrobium sp. YIM 101495]MTD30180.1 hypothetical protein [Planomicrobium sp. YIM 101495]
MNRDTRQKGDRYRPIVTIAKTSGGKPSVVEISGSRYILDHRAENTRNRRRKYESATGRKAEDKRRRVMT